jgi:hypothetical protein
MHRTLPGNEQKARHETTAYQFLVPGSSEVSSEVSPALPETPDQLGQTVLFEPVPPTGVQAGDPADLSSRTKILATKSRRAKRDKDLTPAADNLGAAPPENAGSVVAAFIDSFKDRWDQTPISWIIRRVGRDAKMLLAEGIPFDVLIQAATEMGTTQYANLGAGAHRITTLRADDARYQGQSWLKVRTVAPYPVASGSGTARDVGTWDAVGTWGRERAVAPDPVNAVAPRWDAAVRWYAGDDGDACESDYTTFENDDEIAEPYL